jgi:DNA polymerase III delta subunit
MNYLLYGADTYRSRKKLNEIIAEYRAKTGGGDTNLYRFDAQEHDLVSLRAAAAGDSLFASKKLIIVERPFTAGGQFELTRLTLEHNRVKPDCLLVAWDEALEGEAGERLADAAAYFDKAQEFSPLRGTALNRWINEEARSAGVTLSPAEFSALAVKNGDLWSLRNEMEKLAVNPGARSPGASIGESVIFDLGDTFFSSPVQALRHLLELLARGEEEGRIFSYLASHARTLLIVKSYLTARGSITAGLKIHPYVIKKASLVVRTLSLRDLIGNLKRFLEEDRRIKTGITRPVDSLMRLVSLWR